MKRSFLILMVLVGAFSFWSMKQHASKAADTRRYAYGAPYVSSGDPAMPLEALLVRSQSEVKPLLLLFTGSQWCPACEALNEAVFTQPEWQRFVEDEIILVVYDFTATGAAIGESAEVAHLLAGRFGVQGFPTMLKIKHDGTVSDVRIGYQGGQVADYMRWAR